MKKITTIFTLLVILAISSAIVNAQFPAFPPSNVTNTQDRDQMMWQLGIAFPSLPAKLDDPNAPPDAYPSNSSNPEGNWTDPEGHTITRSGFGLWSNYDDRYYGFFPGPDSEKVGNYSKIDLLKMHDGTIITTPEQWWSMRRPEILEDIQEEVWGVVPPASVLPQVTWSVTTSTGGSGSSAYKQKVITGTIDISRYPAVRNVPRISATVRVPANATEAVPVIIIFGGSISTYYGYTNPNGWGACIFDPGSLQPDNGAGLSSYLIGLCNQGNWRSPTDWGTLAAWSWGISKLIDYFETDPDVDETKIGVSGHSRYGKAALVAMAYEPRLAIAFPSCGGSLGTKMNRRHWGQNLENSGWDQEYHWMAGNFFKWMGPLNEGEYMPRKIELCPVDAHSLLALCAPCPVFINGGTGDSWTDPYGMYLTGVEASPVYELLGKTGLIMPDAKPQVDVGYISGDIAYRYHNGGHLDSPDWPSFLQFAERYFEDNTPKVNTKVFLEGPYSAGSMSTALNGGGHIPLAQPYSGSPWNYSGSESVTSGFFASHADIVDWVLVELRTGTASGTKIGTRAAFLKSNGTIVDVDGSSAVAFSGIAAGNYYIVIKHRNHLSVMSASAVALTSSSAPLYDFTSGSSQFYGTGGARLLETDVWGLWSGDIDLDKQITTSDYTAWYNSARAGDSGYQLTDINLDGQVITSDYTIWFNNARAGASSQVPQIITGCPSSVTPCDGCNP